MSTFWKKLNQKLTTFLKKGCQKPKSIQNIINFLFFSVNFKKLNQTYWPSARRTFGPPQHGLRPYSSHLFKKRCAKNSSLSDIISIFINFILKSVWLSTTTPAFGRNSINFFIKSWTKTDTDIRFLHQWIKVAKNQELSKQVLTTRFILPASGRSENNKL